MRADAEGMARLGLSPDSVIGARVAECGFDLVERDDGMRPEGPGGLYDPGGARRYNAWLRDKGYDSPNPWHDFANAGRDEAGRLASGWFLRNAARAAAIDEPDSETPYLTGRAIEFMAGAEAPWLCHLSYIKPHWPYIAPEPYASMFGPGDVWPAERAGAERGQGAHPILRAFQRNRIGRAFSRDEVRETVIPAYMGLVRQCDDQFGRLIAWMEENGRMRDTMIVVTSDHGDYLGDHWLGEKDLFHDASAKIPLIVYDPRPEADATRGTVCGALVESLDLAATFVEAAGGAVPDHVLEGRSLLPWLEDRPPAEWRDAVISEYDWSTTPMAEELGVAPKDARLFMVFDGRWKLIHAPGFRPMLYDLQADPQEFVDLGADPAHEGDRARLMARLRDWALRPAQRTTVSDAAARARRAGGMDTGVLIGVWDETEIPPELSARYRGPGPRRRS
jgi:arylsulfatase A-like enzyme